MSIIICEHLALVFLSTGAGLARQVQQADEGAGQGRGLPGEEPNRYPLRHGELQNGNTASRFDFKACI